MCRIKYITVINILNINSTEKSIFYSNFIMFYRRRKCLIFLCNRHQESIISDLCTGKYGIPFTLHNEKKALLFSHF